MTTTIALDPLQAAFVAAMREGEPRYLGARGDREISDRIQRITGRRISGRALIELSERTRDIIGAALTESTADAATRCGI